MYKEQNARSTTIEFDPNVSIRSISVVQYEEGRGSINAISFNDSKGESIAVYNPHGYEPEEFETEIELDENEALVGIYGNMRHRIGSFGFIVK